MAYVYTHTREDNGEVFYIGISKQNNSYKRAYWKYRKNDIWKKITSKTNYIVNIVHDNITIEEARELEIKLINKYGRINLKKGTLANLTDGGEGLKSYVFTDEQKKYLSNAQKKLYLNGYVNPNKNKKLSDETKDKMSKSLKGKTSWNKGLKTPESVKIKLSKSKLNTKHSEETKKKMSISAKGKVKWSIKLLNTETGEIFSSIKKAYTYYGISRATFYRKLNKKESIYKRVN
jgi:hypothetical protein